MTEKINEKEKGFMKIAYYLMCARFKVIMERKRLTAILETKGRNLVVIATFKNNKTDDTNDTEYCYPVYALDFPMEMTEKEIMEQVTDGYKTISNIAEDLEDDNRSEILPGLWNEDHAPSEVYSALYRARLIDMY